LALRPHPQDLGNINFSFLSERAAFSKTANAQLVVRALEGLGVAATVGPRNDLLVDGLKVRPPAPWRALGR